MHVFGNANLNPAGGLSAARYGAPGVAGPANAMQRAMVRGGPFGAIPTTRQPVSRSFGAITPTGSLSELLDSMSEAEADLRTLRASLTALGQQYIGMGRFLPDAAVESYHSTRRSMASATAKAIQQIIDLADNLDASVPFGSTILDYGSKVRQALGGSDWVDRMLTSIPLLPADIVSPALRSSHMTSIDSMALFGEPITGTVIAGLVTSLALYVTVAFLAYEVSQALHARANEIRASTDQQRAWTDDRVQCLSAAVSAGVADPADWCNKNRPPPPSPPSAGLGDIIGYAISGVVALAVIGGVIWYLKGRS